LDFIDACKVVLRRWYVVVPLALLTMAGTYFAYSNASANYSAKGSLVLTPPVAVVGADGTAGVCVTNTYCTGGDVLGLANVTGLRMDDPTVQSELLDPHPGASYEVLLNSDNRSSIMQLTATSRTPADALSTLHDVTGQVEHELQDIQVKRGAKEQDLVQASTVTMARKAVPQSGGKLRAAAAAFGLGVAVTLGAAFLAESIAASRRANASLLDRIALPDQPSGATGAAKARPSPSVGPDAADGAAAAAARDRPKPVSAGPRRSGRVGS
jgi:hypothetical protein